MEDFDQTLAIGVVFDLSPKSYHEKRLLLDLVKDGLIAYATQLGLNCGILVSHPDYQVMPRRQGESVAAIANYIEPEKFDIEKAMKHALNVVGNQTDNLKYLIVLTNRYNDKNKYRYEKAVILNQTKRFDCKIIFVDFSNNCPNFEHSKTICVSDPSCFNISEYF